MSTLAADAFAERLVTFCRELLAVRVELAADPDDAEGHLLVASGVVIAHVDGRGRAHPLVGVHVLLAIALGVTRGLTKRAA